MNSNTEKNTKKIKNKTPKKLILGIICPICALFILLGWFYYKKPLMILREQNSILKEKKDELEDKKRMEAELENKIAFLKTPEGMNYIAKSNGFFEKDDILITITQTEPSNDKKDTKKKKKKITISFPQLNKKHEDKEL